MLALIGLLTIIIMLALIMTKKLQTLLALIIVPIIGCLIAGFAGLIQLEEGSFTITTLGSFITQGLQSIAPTGVMFIFAILFFGLMSDAGTFDPIINGILKIVGKSPVKICIGTVILTSVVHLDGSGAATFLIVIPAMLPLYKKNGNARNYPGHSDCHWRWHHEYAALGRSNDPCNLCYGFHRWRSIHPHVHTNDLRIRNGYRCCRDPG